MCCERMKWFIFMIIVFLSSVSAQYLGSPQLSGVGLPFFNTEVFPTFTRDGKQILIRIYVQMLNDDITFVKADTGFVAELQIDILISDKKENYIFNRTINRQVFALDFEETNSRDIKNTFYTEIPLDSGSYQVIITVRDKNSNKQVNRKVHFQIPSFKNSPFLLSNMLFFNIFERDSSGRIVQFEPNLMNNFSGDSQYLYIYFQTIAFRSDEKLKISYIIKDPDGGINQMNTYVVQNPTQFQEHYIRLNRHQFDRNRYVVQLIGRMGESEYKWERTFSFYWTVSPESPEDLDRALEQMLYIAEEDSIDYYVKRSYKEKKQYFARFWANMDPNPETEKNELMDEYFRRVNFANQNFSTLGYEGWKTDRGRIFIKFGEPDDIEKHPFEVGSYPYEIWRYYQLRKEFLFIDRTGFGDYYLHPSYIDEEYN